MKITVSREFLARLASLENSDLDTDDDLRRLENLVFEASQILESHPDDTAAEQLYRASLRESDDMHCNRFQYHWSELKDSEKAYWRFLAKEQGP